MFFAVLAVAAQLDRNYLREKTLECRQTAAAKGNHGGRPKVIDDDMLTFVPSAPAGPSTAAGPGAQRLTGPDHDRSHRDFLYPNYSHPAAAGCGPPRQARLRVPRGLTRSGRGHRPGDMLHQASRSGLKL
jgi:hypothetical protein